MRPNLIIQVILLCLFATYTGAQEVPQIISYDRAEYKASHQNWSIAKDCDGYLYLANTDGVLFHNGFSWRLLPMPARQIPRALYLGSDCKMYVSGYQFFGTIDHSSKASAAIVSVQDDLLNNTSQEIWNIFGHNDDMYFQSFSNLYYYNNQHIQEIETPTNVMLGGIVHNRVYIPKIEKGIYLYEEGNLQTVSAADQLPPDAKVAALVPYPSQQVLVGTQYHGLFVLSNKSIKPLDSGLNDQLIKLQINKIAPLLDGGYAIGTILGGLFITDQNLNVKFHISKSNGLANNTVLSLLQQENGDLWVGLDQGFNLIKLSSDDQYYYDEGGQLGSVFTSIVYENTLYLGTNQGLFEQQADGTFALVENSQGQIWSMAKIDGDLLIGHNTGTYHYTNGDFTRVSDVTGAWTMAALPDNRILQTTYTGLVTLKKGPSGWAFDRRLTDGNILVSQAKLSGYTLLGHHPNYGVCRLTLNEDYTAVVEHLTAHQIADRSLAKDVLIAHPSDSLGFLIDKDVYTFTDAGPQLVADGQSRDGFKASMNFKEHLAALGSRLSLNNSTYVNKSQTSEPLLLGTDDGYIKAVTKKIAEGLPMVDYVLQGGLLIEDIENGLGPTQNDVSIQCRDTSFNWHHRNLQYQVLGWDENWFELPSNGLIELLNLDAGNYEVKLRSRDQEASLISFTIRPFWYESWPGYLLYAFASLAILWLFVNYNRAKLKKQKYQLQVEKRKEIESALIKSENERLEREVKYKSRMLENSTMTLVHKNKMLAELKEVIQKETNKQSEAPFPKQKLYNLIDKNIHNDNDWEVFEQNFAAVHADFLEKLKHECPTITIGELKLAAYIKMNLSSKEIAPLLNISVRSIENKRYRLRKKLNIPHENNLKDYLLRL